MLVFIRYYINITYKNEKNVLLKKSSHKPSGLTAMGVDAADMITGATGVAASLAIEGASTADGMMDQVFLGFTLKTWIIIFLVLIIIGHSQNKMPWNTPVKPTQY
jgi:hypothetical protein